MVKSNTKSYVQTPTLPDTTLSIVRYRMVGIYSSVYQFHSQTSFMSNGEETKSNGEEEKRIKRTQSLEASVTLGLGYGQKKTQHEAFFSAVWPVLEGAGWTLVSEFVRVLLGSHKYFWISYLKINLTLQEIYRQGSYVTSLGSCILANSTTRLIPDPLSATLFYQQFVALLHFR